MGGAAKYIISAVLGSFAISFAFDHILADKKIFGGKFFFSQFSSTPLHSTAKKSNHPTTCTSHKTIRVVVLKKKTAKETPSQLKTKHRRSACSFSFMTGREAPPIHQINYVQLLHLVV